MDYKTEILKLNKNKKVANIKYNGKIYKADIKYSISHGYYSEFFVGKNIHRARIDKDLIENKSNI